MRVLPLIASATELVCALGYRRHLVGRSHECDYPPDVQSLPQATMPRFDTAASSRAIDAQVKALVSGPSALDALGVYAVLPEALRAMQPTHIITQTQCEVCAVTPRDVEAAIAQVSGCEPRIVSVQPNTLADIWDDFRRVASALGAAAAGTRLVDSLRNRMDAVASVARNVPSPPTVAVIEWVDPLMASGNWVPELIAMAGGRCVLGRPGQHSPWLSFDELRSVDPDAILICPCGFGIERTLQDAPILQAQPGWTSLRAVRAGRVFVADGNAFFHRPGPRLAETLEILAEILHPGRFEFGHRNSAWRPLNG